MTAEEIQTLISNHLPCEVCHVDGDGRHWYATVVSASFEGVRAIARHQRVYAAMGSRMKTDEVHALSIKAYTPAEWAIQSA
jgi:acid stress-induced BolA-like protein IbaG/YrbA